MYSGRWACTRTSSLPSPVAFCIIQLDRSRGVFFTEEWSTSVQTTRNKSHGIGGVDLIIHATQILTAVPRRINASAMDCRRCPLHVSSACPSPASTLQPAQDIIAILGLDELSEDDRLVVSRARKIERFMSQPFFVAEFFTNSPGQYVKLQATIAGLLSVLAVGTSQCSAVA